MSSYYDPVYTSIERVKDLTQVDIHDTSVPTQRAVYRWIEEIENEITERALGNHTVTNQYVDIPIIEGTAISHTQWTYDVEDAKFRFDIDRGTIVPLANVKHPFIAITTLETNDQDPEDAPSWTTLTEGPADGSSFILLQTGRKDWGYAIWFYDNYPYEGPKRLRIDYTYGWNVDPDILSYWATLMASVRVLIARMGSSSISGLGWLEGGDLGTHTNTQYESRIRWMYSERDRIEIEYFPSEATDEPIAMGVL
jgi:hypothetical protein